MVGNCYTIRGVINISVDALGYTLALLTICASFISVRYRNLLLTLGAAILWATLLAFILANTVAGTNWQSLFILGVVTFLCAFALISFFTRSKGDGSVGANFGGLFPREEKGNSPVLQRRGMMDLSNDEYRAMVRARIRRRTR